MLSVIGTPTTIWLRQLLSSPGGFFPPTRWARPGAGGPVAATPKEPRIPLPRAESPPAVGGLKSGVRVTLSAYDFPTQTSIPMSWRPQGPQVPRAPVRPSALHPRHSTKNFPLQMVYLGIPQHGCHLSMTQPVTHYRRLYGYISLLTFNMRDEAKGAVRS